jgi:hypothetical protein
MVPVTGMGIGTVAISLPGLMAVVAGAAVALGWLGARLAMPVYACPGRHMETSTQCRTLEKAAELYTNLEGPTVGCPTIDDLVRAGLISRLHTSDAWGTVYAIECESDDIRARSAGPDRRFQTPDDVDSDWRGGR